jgi:hypothetical protein
LPLQTKNVDQSSITRFKTLFSSSAKIHFRHPTGASEKCHELEEEASSFITSNPRWLYPDVCSRSCVAIEDSIRQKKTLHLVYISDSSCWKKFVSFVRESNGSPCVWISCSIPNTTIDQIHKNGATSLQGRDGILKVRKKMILSCHSPVLVYKRALWSSRARYLPYR